MSLLFEKHHCKGNCVSEVNQAEMLLACNVIYQFTFLGLNPLVHQKRVKKTIKEMLGSRKTNEDMRCKRI